MILGLYEMQSVSSKIWTRVTVSISYDDNHYFFYWFWLVFVPFSQSLILWYLNTWRNFLFYHAFLYILLVFGLSKVTGKLIKFFVRIIYILDYICCLSCLLNSFKLVGSGISLLLLSPSVLAFSVGVFQLFFISIYYCRINRTAGQTTKNS